MDIILVDHKQLKFITEKRLVTKQNPPNEEIEKLKNEIKQLRIESIGLVKKSEEKELIN